VPLWGALLRWDWVPREGLESEAPEVEFVELSENPQETEEIFELVPVVEGVSEDTNLAGTQEVQQPPAEED